jgi:hypothetical protein|tara:strand:+ start:273 stop:479 length:207 start_codon:yes stop_codon:yes gene_type:complete
MNSGKRHNFKKISKDEMRQLFLMKHPKIPHAILGACMEREAYLGVLVYVALDAAPLKKRNGKLILMVR